MLYSILGGIILVLTLAILLLLRRLMKTSDQLKEALRAAEDHIAQYASFQLMYAKTRAWRHDYRNHQQVMYVLLQTGHYDELKAYFRENCDDYQEISEMLATGHFMLDIVVGMKARKARFLDIAFETDIAAPSSMPMTDYQLSRLLGNLLDNAIEACERIPEKSKRFLRLTIGTLGESLLIKTENSTDGAVPVENGVFRTRKKVGEHGLGLKAIDDISEKAGGQTVRFHRNRVFVSETCIPLYPGE